MTEVKIVVSAESEHLDIPPDVALQLVAEIRASLQNHSQVAWDFIFITEED